MKKRFHQSSSCLCYNSQGILGVDQSVQRKYCASLTEQSKVVSILALAEKAGMSTGIVTTTRVTHATPASAYAHLADRDWESDADKTSKAKDDASKCEDAGNYTDLYETRIRTVNERSYRRKEKILRESFLLFTLTPVILHYNSSSSHPTCPNSERKNYIK